MNMWLRLQCHYVNKKIITFSRVRGLCRFGVRVTCHRFVRCRLVDITHSLGEVLKRHMDANGFST